MMGRLLIIMGTLFAQIAFAAQICDKASLPADAPDMRFQHTASGAVLDTQTGLMWATCLVGMANAGCDKGEPLTLNWADALKQSQKANQERLAGFSDWRLPNIRELASLVELQCASPAINLSVFPNQPVTHSWSSSPYRFYDHYAWYLDWQDGVYIYGDRQDLKTLRLVRDPR